MTQHEYDVIAVGGGLGGSALGKALAERGYRVLVLERGTEFSDRVRGEVLVPWGCAEAERLGLYDLLHDDLGHELHYWDTIIGGVPIMRRNLVETLPTGHPVLTFFHPEMQERLRDAAIAAGADYRSGAAAKGVELGSLPRVTYEAGGNVHTATARLVVAADGRTSAARKWGAFEIEKAKKRRFFGGVIMEGIDAAEDTMHGRFDPAAGLMSWLFPQGGGRSRNYIGFHADSDFKPLNGEKDIPRFIETTIALGAPEETFRNAKAVGPLATFDATDLWIPHPYRDGLALIGDAAVTSDPTWGQGMSLTLFDVRLLVEALEADEDWDAAGHAFASAHDTGTSAIREADSWYTDILLDIGPEADARRERALPLILEDQSRIPDTPLVGPSFGATEEMRQRFFGEI